MNNPHRGPLVMRARESLLLSAAEYLAWMGYPHAPFTVIVRQGDSVHREAVPAWPERPPAPADGPGWKMFSDDEAAIVEALRGKGPVTTEELALTLGKTVTTELRATLRGLAKRDVVEVTQRDGVRLIE